VILPHDQVLILIFKRNLLSIRQYQKIGKKNKMAKFSRIFGKKLTRFVKNHETLVIGCTKF
jgi:hypothetical protein